MTASTDPVQRRHSPLGAWTARLAAASTDRLAIRELAFLTQVNLRGNSGDPAFAAAVDAVLGYALPERPNTWSASAESQAIWLGPDEWLLVAGDGQGETLAAKLDAALRNVHHAVTDVSANRAVIEIDGGDSRLVLAKGCSLDMHSQSFGSRDAAQTLLAQTQALLQCMEVPTRFRLYVRNSFSQYLAAWLLDAAAECAASRTLDTGRISSRLA